MKRVGFLFNQITDRENLLLAYAKASRGKCLRAERVAFGENLEANITALGQGLRELSYPVGNYSRFTIYDPKEREICAVPFAERVEAFANGELGLELKQRPFVNRTSAGMDFLGFRVFPERVALSRVSARRYASRVRGITRHCADEQTAQMRMTSMTAFVMQADSHAWRAKKLKDI